MAHTRAEQVLARLSLPVRTERLTLRRARADDVDAVWAYRGRPEVSRWMTLGGDRDDFHARFVDPQGLAGTLLVEHDGALIGDLRISVEDAWGQSEVAARAQATQAELGWCIVPEHAGRGYATEAASALLRLCFRGLGLRRVTASCFAENEPSQRLMERLGLRLEGRGVRDSLHRSGRWLDGAYYALLAEEWELLHANEEEGRR